MLETKLSGEAAQNLILTLFVVLNNVQLVMVIPLTSSSLPRLSTLF